MFCEFNPALKCRAIVIASLRDEQTRQPQSSAYRIYLGDEDITTVARGVL